MRRKAPIVVAFLHLLAAGCGSKSPIAPAPAPAFALSQTTVTVGRHETAQVTAQFGVQGSQQDVTAATTWTSSNPAIVTVDGGLVTAASIGTATVTAAYQGQTQMLAVTARRRTAITGAIELDDTKNARTLATFQAYVDGREIGYEDVSHGEAALTVTLGFGLEDPRVIPGAHEISVTVFRQANPPNTYASNAVSNVVVVDADTLEPLATISLPSEQMTMSTSMDAIKWTIQVSMFSS